MDLLKLPSGLVLILPIPIIFGDCKPLLLPSGEIFVMNYTFDILGVTPIFTFFNYQQQVESDRHRSIRFEVAGR